MSHSPEQGVAKAGLKDFDLAFVQGSPFVFRLNINVHNPRLPKYPNRWLQGILTHPNNYE